MTYDFDALLGRVEKPGRYTGGEMNAGVKPIAQAEISFAFCFPDTYEVAMSHLGMKILYGILNGLPYAVCERVCMPWVDMLSELRKNHIPLCSLESHTPLSRFDIIGFTLQYEMSYTNVLEMMDLGGVPVLSSERGEDDPIVLAGGPCAFNPEPLHLFIDAFLIGDGEDSIVEVTDVLNTCKKEGVPRPERLRRLAALRGVYVPGLYHDEYNADGTLKSLEPVDPCAPPRVLRSILTNFENAYAPTRPPVRRDQQKRHRGRSGQHLDQRLFQRLERRQALLHDRSAHRDGRRPHRYRGTRQNRRGGLLQRAEGKARQGPAHHVQRGGVRAKALHALPVVPSG